MMSRKHVPPSTLKLSNDDRLHMLANMIVDRVLEEKQLYTESLNNDQSSEKEFDPKDFLKFVKKRRKQFYKQKLIK